MYATPREDTDIQVHHEESHTLSNEPSICALASTPFNQPYLVALSLPIPPCVPARNQHARSGV